MITRGRISVLLCLLLIFGLSGPSLAQQDRATRLKIGINLLPAVIAANSGLGSLEAGQKLSILLVYRENRFTAEQLKKSIDRIGLIRKRGLIIETIALDQLLRRQTTPMTTIFITESIDNRLPELIEFSQARRALLFSPIKGDVERGVATGFRVTDKVLPLVNTESLKQSKIQLKAFFLRIAVQHEQ